MAAVLSDFYKICSILWIWNTFANGRNCLSEYSSETSASSWICNYKPTDRHASIAARRSTLSAVTAARTTEAATPLSPRRDGRTARSGFSWTAGRGGHAGRKTDGETERQKRRRGQRLFYNSARSEMRRDVIGHFAKVNGEYRPPSSYEQHS